MRTIATRAGVAGALSLLSLGAGAAAPAAAQSPAPPASPAPSPDAGAPAPAKERSSPRRARVRLGVRSRRLDVVSGRRATVRGVLRPGRAATVALQLRRGGRWRTIDRDRTSRSGAFALADRRRTTGSLPVRLRVTGARVRTATRSLGRLEVYRRAYASWYGPGLYGNRLGCGGTLGTGTLGVAHKTLPCGTQVTFRRGGRSVRVRVIDRGPYVGGREYDLTAATAQRLGFRGHGPVLATR